MASLDEVINRELIKLDLEGETKEEVIDELANLLDQQHKLLSRDEFINAVHEREAILSTHVGFGVAIPHGISSAVETPTVCFGRSKGLLWDDVDENVCFVFLLAIPENRAKKDHMGLLSEVAKASLNAEIRALWQEARSADDILDSLRLSMADTESDASEQNR